MPTIANNRQPLPTLSMRLVVHSLLAGILLAQPALAIDSPLDIGTQSQLVADKTWIADSHAVSFALQPAEKHPANPLVKADRPWEGWRLEIYGSVLYDEEEKLFKMWYAGIDTPDFDQFATFYATSKDGLVWDKPPAGTEVARTGLKGHNAVLNGCCLASVIKDTTDPSAEQRYKMVCWVQKPKPEGGPHTFVSPDGLRWTRLSREPICRSNDVITAYFDEQRKCYVAFPKHSTAVRGPVRRCFAQTTSTDFLAWTAPRYVFIPDVQDDAGSLTRIEEVRSMLDVPDDPALMRTEFYGLGVHVAESCTLAFPWVFTINNNARYGNHEGPCELQLAVSRDLQTWSRDFRQPIVPRGQAGEWDSGFFTTAARTVVVGDEVWLYYGGSNYTHGTPCLYREEGTGRGTRYTGSIGLAKWQRDRFVSAEAGREGGTIETMPVRFSGNRLEINAAIQSGGSVVVELCGLQGNTLLQSKPVEGDGLRLPVTWEDAAAVANHSGSPVILRFTLKDAKLFAFAFRK